MRIIPKMTPRIMTKKILLSIIFLLFLACQIASQSIFDSENKKAKAAEPTVPSTNTVRLIDLGLHNAAGDLAWLGAIQYYGSSAYGPFPKLKDYLRLATDLNPKFSYPYAFGALILPGEKETDAGIELGKIGIENADPEWRIPYNLALTYHTKKNDRKNAAYYFALAANTQGAPDPVKNMAAFYTSNSSDREVTKKIWQNIAETSTDEVSKQRALDYVYHFELLDLLEQAATAYKNKTGQFPKTIDDLVAAKIIPNKPTDPFGFTIIFDSDGKTVVQ